MDKLNVRLQQIKSENRIGLMTHVIVGFPSVRDTIKIIKTMAEAGVDIVELQIPFSDPLADGPTIMQACEQSLENGTKVKDAFMVMAELTKQVAIPLLFMAYYNTVYKYGVENFCKAAKTAGAAGLIVPDMPIDEERYDHFFANVKKYNLQNIQVISPASTPDRLEKNAKIAQGFVYCTARQGITGVKDQLDPQISNYLKEVKKYFTISLAVGFGISKREHIQALKPYAEIAVIGSAIIDIIRKAKDGQIEKDIKLFLSDLKTT